MPEGLPIQNHMRVKGEGEALENLKRMFERDLNIWLEQQKPQSH
jgi:hypothetical protein